MQQYRKNLGKVSLTAEGIWDNSKKYELLSIVYDEHTQHAFISKKEVPSGIDLYNAEFWMPLNVSGYVDSNIIILNNKISESAIQSYTLEEAIKSISPVGRRPGLILCFFNSNTNRLDIGGRWEIWQFNSNTISEWEDISSWTNIYYNYNKFVGWYKTETLLKATIPFPEVGCYAYVGSDLNEATIYRCDRKYTWDNTTEHVWDYIKVIVGGNVSVGENGNWFNNGVDTNIPASVKGENGKTPIIRNNNNILEVSYDDVKWTPISDEISTWFRINNNKLEISRHEAGDWKVISDYIAAWFRWQSDGGEQITSVGKIQITRDGVSWTDLSGNFVNHLRISKYIGADESLPTSGIAEGTIYAKGPTYDTSDTSHSNPIYRLWVYAWKDNNLAWQDNGKFTSIAAGVVQESGDSETEVMSQKVVTEKLSELGSEVSNKEYASKEKLYKPESIAISYELINAKYINENGEILPANESWNLTLYQVSIGDSIIISGTETPNYVVYALLDINKNVLYYQPIIEGRLNYTFTISDKSFAYLAVNVDTHPQGSKDFQVYKAVLNVTTEKQYAKLNDLLLLNNGLRAVDFSIGGYYKSDGTLTGDAQWFQSTPMIEIPKVLYVNKGNQNNIINDISLFDENKVYLTRIQLNSNDNYFYEFPIEAKFFSISKSTAVGIIALYGENKPIRKYIDEIDSDLLKLASLGDEIPIDKKINAKFINSDGAIANANSVWNVELYKVSEGDVVIVSGVLSPSFSAFALLNENEFVYNFKPVQEGVTKYAARIPNGVAYFAINRDTSIQSDSDFKVYKGLFSKKSDKSLEGKKWLAVGDSITAQATYINKVVSELGLIATNIGVGGMKLSQEGGMASESRLALISNDNYDIITLLAGTNDWAQDVPIGDDGDFTISTFKGAANIFIDYVSSNCPTIPFIVCTTPYGSLYQTINDTNNLGLTPNDYGDAIKQIAIKWNIPVAEIGRQSWNKNNIRSYVKDDGGLLHPMQNGGDKMGNILISKIKELLGL